MKSPAPVAWKAGDLTSDLMAALAVQGWIAVAEIALSDRLTHRGDVVAMLVSGRRNRVDIYELKVARSDLLSDLRREKWRAYLEHGRVWFAFPDRLADPREIPPEAGVIIRRGDGWRRMRAPQAFVGDPSVALMRRLVMAVRSQRPTDPKPRTADLWRAADRARTETAKRVMQVANDLVTWERILEKTKEELRLVEAQKRQLETEVRKLTREHRQTSLFGAAA